MAWLIGLKADESIFEFSNKKPDFDLTELQALFDSDDYSFYQLTTQNAKRISDGDSYAATWASNEITGVDFSIEDDKYWLHVSADDSYILNKPTSSTDIDFEIWDEDNVAIDTSINTTDVRIPVETPDGPRVVRIDFSSGAANLNFATTKSGTYKFPGNEEGYNTLRIHNQVTVEVDDDDIF